MGNERSASANDVSVAIDVLGRYGSLEYREAVAKVANERGYKPSAVYGIVARARHDTRTIGGVAALRVEQGENMSQLAQGLGYSPRELKRMIRAYEQDEARKEHEGDALNELVPRGHFVKGVSKLVDAGGGVIMQWIKTDAEKQKWTDVINAVLDSIPNRITPREPVSQGAAQLADMLALYPLADLHIGLYSSSLDAERDWGLDTAAQAMMRGIDDLIARTPPAATAIIANLGDFTHNDNGTNRTPANGNALDVDGRFIEVAQAAMEIAVYAIDRAAEHHQNVSVIWQSGNHDEATALVLQTALATLYRNDARVTVHRSGKRTHCIQWGRCALAFTHGDTIKADNLPLLMANDYPGIWADTTYRVWHVGHIHQRTMREYPGCLVESHQSPAPRDAWHEQQGYRARHSMTSIVYDQRGEYARNIVQVLP